MLIQRLTVRPIKHISQMKLALARRIRGFPVLAFWLGLSAALMGNGMAQAVSEARVAASSIRIEPVVGSKEVRVTLRLVDTPSITGAMATTGSGTAPKQLPVSWIRFEDTPPANCAWMIVIDSSNPARQRTVEACAAEVRTFLSLLPRGDAVMLASLARDLVVAAPFESTQAQLEAGLAQVNADGDAALTTLIFQNVKHALADHLARRTETRRCVILLTDGKDETPGGPVAAKARRDELITEAKKLGIPVHTFGFAEKATEANYFADLKELSIQTEGLHAPAGVATRQLAPATWPSLVGVMHGGGTAVLDVSSLMETAPVKLELTSESGRRASVVIPREAVERVLHSDPAQTSAVKSADPQPRPEDPIMPVWGWAAVGVVLLVVLASVSRRPKAGSVMEVTQKAAFAHAEPAAAPVSGNASVPPACLEFCDAIKSRHTVMAQGVRIGGGRHNDIVIKDDSVSENHCVIAMKNGEWTISDLESANGVRVNGTYYHQATLSTNDRIQLGEVQMRFVAES